MKENLMLSAKGQITLPAAMRRALGLHGNAIVTAEQQGGRIVLVPAMVVETRVYGDAEIRAWQQDDSFAPGERAALSGKLVRSRTKKRDTTPATTKARGARHR